MTIDAHTDAPESACKTPFLVLGVPRSGTTFFATVLNNHPDVLCGIERFHGRKFSPEHLTENGFLNLDLDRKVAAGQMDLIKQKLKHPNLVLGEKFPRAYLHLDQTLPRFEAAGKRVKMVVLMRDIHEVASSWFVRGTNYDDMSWPNGMHGVFPFIEQFILAWQLSLLERPEDVVLVSYAKVYHPDTATEVWSKIADHLAVADAAPFLQAVQAGAAHSKASRNRDRSQDSPAFSVQDDFYPSLLAPIDEHGVCSLTSVQDEMRSLVAGVRQKESLLTKFETHLGSETDPIIAKYQPAIGRMYNLALKPLDKELGVRLMTAAARPAEHLSAD